ncbi:hypothetical protein ACQF36_17700 [Streptomyces sp. Marseille-Q5077]|uniref:hypothetical protein n=1 Tax=Streptomyces sp. Marseille-Q5077 TaxID=3418995 RepID=UPI003D004385
MRALLQAESGGAYVGRVTSVANFVGLGVAPLTFPHTGGAVGLCAGGLRRVELPR